MKIVSKIFLSLLLLLPLSVSGQKNYLNDPMVRIAMSAYAAQIEQDPRNYNAYYSRAKDYFRYGESALALADLNKAIEYFPENEAADLSQAYTMRALILQQNGDHAAALKDLNEALKLDSQSHYSLLARADLLCEMNDYDHAKDDYQTILRRDARCQDAYLGLARIAMKEQNMGVCNENLKKAQEANPSNTVFYVQRGALYEEMDEPRKAADDYVMAVYYGDNSHAVLALDKLAKSSYEPVIEALTVAIEQLPDKGFFYFLRATIHKNNHRYSASIKDWNEIVENRYFYYHSIFINRAFCYERLGQFEYALEDINKAITMKSDEMSYYIMRGKLYRIMGLFDKAGEDLALAATFDPAHVEMLQQRGLLAVEKNELDVAQNFFNEAVIYDAGNPLSYLLRAENYMKSGDKEAADHNYEMILNQPEETPAVASLRGFALARLGRGGEAEAWIENILQDATSLRDAETLYLAACLYAQIGQRERAYKYLEDAFKAGYGDYYNVYFENDTPVSLSPLRNEPDFRSLVESYHSIF